MSEINIFTHKHWYLSEKFSPKLKRYYAAWLVSHLQQSLLVSVFGISSQPATVLPPTQIDWFRLSHSCSPSSLSTNVDCKGSNTGYIFQSKLTNCSWCILEMLQFLLIACSPSAVNIWAKCNHFIVQAVYTLYKCKICSIQTKAMSSTADDSYTDPLFAVFWLATGGCTATFGFFRKRLAADDSL